MKELLYNLERTPSSGAQLLSFVKGRSNLITYPEIYKYSSLEQLLGEFQACIILYEFKQHFGHWCCCFRTAAGVEFFDPYGYIVDNEFKFISKGFQEKNYPDTRYLSKLIYNSGLPLEYNDYQLQNRKDHSIATCGYWVGVRLKYRNVPIDKFAKVFYEFPPWTPDQIVTLMFYGI